MIKPAATRHSCPQCGWNRICCPRSDALVGIDEQPPRVCPRCGHAALQVTLASPVSGMLHALNARFGSKRQ